MTEGSSPGGTSGAAPVSPFTPRSSALQQRSAQSPSESFPHGPSWVVRRGLVRPVSPRAPRPCRQRPRRRRRRRRAARTCATAGSAPPRRTIRAPPRSTPSRCTGNPHAVDDVLHVASIVVVGSEAAGEDRPPPSPRTSSVSGASRVERLRVGERRARRCRGPCRAPRRPHGTRGIARRPTRLHSARSSANRTRPPSQPMKRPTSTAPLARSVRASRSWPPSVAARGDVRREPRCGRGQGVHRAVEEAGLDGPPHQVVAADPARCSWRSAARHHDLSPGVAQFLRDLTARLSAAHHQHDPVGDGVGGPVGARVQGDQTRRKLVGAARPEGSPGRHRSQTTAARAVIGPSFVCRRTSPAFGTSDVTSIPVRSGVSLTAT